MNGSERRQLNRSLERRVLAGEHKADIVSEAAADGGDWSATARIVALIPTPAHRHRYRWLNRLLLALLLLAAAAELLIALAQDADSWWRLLDLLPLAFFLLPLWPVAHYRCGGYSLAASLAATRLGLLAVHLWHGSVSVPGGLAAAQLSLCVAVVLLAVFTQRRLLPESRTWTGSGPKTDAAGNLRFEE
jgi:hypothetical protein